MMKNISLIIFCSLAPFLPCSFAQNVGVGITSPLSKLHVKGTANVPQFIIDAHSVQNNMMPLIKLRNSLGTDLMWIHSDDSSNVFIGLKAGRANSLVSGSGIFNTFIGTHNGYSNTTGSFNTSNGNHAFYFNTEGSSNLALGHQALYNSTQGNYNTAVGSNALYSNVLGSGLTAVGYNAMRNVNTSDPFITDYSVAVGYNALAGPGDGSPVTGFLNTAIGYNTLSNTTTGSGNTASGSEALASNDNGNNNSAHGYAALTSNTTGGFNTAHGSYTLNNISTGSNNTAIGYGTLYSSYTGSNNTALGYAADIANDEISNATVIGANAYAAVSNSVIIGSVEGINNATVSTNVGMGTTAPHSSAALEVNSIDKGMLVPRIALVATNSASPVSSPADALLVYNTATSGSGSNEVEPGFYYWKASENKWRSLNQPEENSGYGTWGDCSMNNVSQYNPVAADDGTAIDYLGYSVSISGDYAIAGASEDDNGPNEGQGSAYMYHFNGGQWSQTQKLLASDGAAADYFGFSVAISGNYAIVGSFDDKIGVNEGQGSAYIYFFNGTQWIEQQKLTASDGGPFDAFGISVSIDEDFAAIGALRHDVGANGDQGCVYVFRYNGSTWLQQQKLLAGDPAANQYLGTSVSINNNRIISGTNGATVGGNADQGSAYVFSFNGSVWSQQQKLTAADGGPDDLFGYSVCIQGDDVIVGAFLDDIGGNTNQGSVYIFHFESNTWVQKQKLIANDGSASDEFGISVALYNDHVMIGASGDAIGSNLGQGSTSIYQNINGLWMLYQKVLNPAGGSGHHFGYASSLYEDRFIIGSYGAENDRGIVVFGKINQ